MFFLNKYLSIFGFLKYFPKCITPNSEMMNDEIDKIVSNVYFNYSSSFNIVFASLFHRLNIEKKCLQLSVSLNKITSKDYILLISIRMLYHFFDLIVFIIIGLFKKQYLNIRIVNQLQKKNVVVFEQKKRNFILKDELSNHGLIYVSYSINKTKYSKYNLRLGFKNYIKVINLKIKNFQVKTSFLIKYISLNDGFNSLYKDLEVEKEYKFFSQEGFVYDHRLFISFFKSKKFKTYIFFNNINYSHKVPLLSDHIILKSEKSKKWIFPTDLSKVIVLNDGFFLNKSKVNNSSKIIKIAYLPELYGSHKNHLKQNYLINFIINLKKTTKMDVELLVRDHPQVYNKNNLNSIFSQFNSKHFKTIYDDHSDNFIDFINNIDILFSAYYSTALEDSALIGVPGFVLEYSNENSMRYNSIESDLLKFVKLERDFDHELFTNSFDRKIIASNHKLLIENLFDSSKKITFENALNLEIYSNLLNKNAT